MNKTNILREVLSIKHPEPFNFYISEKLMLKIALAHAKIGDKEWSGILIYKPIGEMNSDNFEIECLDVLIQGVGNSAYTETEYNLDELNDYLLENNLLEYYADGLIRIGHLHTHHSMDVFFSGTDMNDLYKRSEDFDNYFSLITNNNLEFVAKIASRITAAVNLTDLTIKNNIGENLSIDFNEEINQIPLKVVYERSGNYVEDPETTELFEGVDNFVSNLPTTSTLLGRSLFQSTPKSKNYGGSSIGNSGKDISSPRPQWNDRLKRFEDLDEDDFQDPGDINPFNFHH